MIYLNIDPHKFLDWAKILKENYEDNDTLLKKDILNKSL